MPTAWLVRDATLIELARRRPATAEEAEAVRGLQVKRGRQMDELLGVIRDGAGEEPERPPEIPAELRNRVKVVLPLASAVLQARCGEAGIASELVATRDDLEATIRHACRQRRAGTGAARRLATRAGGRIAPATALPARSRCAWCTGRRTWSSDRS